MLNEAAPKTKGNAISKCLTVCKLERNERISYFALVEEIRAISLL